MALKDTELRALQARAARGEKVGKVSDGGGLSFQDGRFWRLSYRFDGKQKTLALGKYPEVSLKMAREGREKAKALIAEGVDPSEQRKQEKAEKARAALESAMTFERVAREWFEKKTVGLVPASRTQMMRWLEKHLFPYIGSIPIASLDLPDIVAALDHLDGASPTAHNAASLAGRICRYARLMQYAKYDVSSGISEILPPMRARKHRAAILDREGLGRLLDDIDHYAGSPAVRYALRIMPYVFVRPTELCEARWEEIDLGNAMWVIPAGRMKMKREHAVPLARQVVRLFSELRSVTGDGRLAFPSPANASKAISGKSLTYGLRSMGYGRADMSVHGFRAVASTLLNESGRFRHDVIEMQLAHVEKNTVRGAYNHARYMEERKAMMQEWADMLDGLKASAAR